MKKLFMINGNIHIIKKKIVLKVLNLIIFGFLFTVNSIYTHLCIFNDLSGRFYSVNVNHICKIVTLSSLL